jgi:hypothetical protein
LKICNFFNPFSFVGPLESHVSPRYLSSTLNLSNLLFFLLTSCQNASRCYSFNYNDIMLLFTGCMYIFNLRIQKTYFSKNGSTCRGPPPPPPRRFYSAVLFSLIICFFFLFYKFISCMLIHC